MFPLYSPSVDVKEVRIEAHVEASKPSGMFYFPQDIQFRDFVDMSSTVLSQETVKACPRPTVIQMKPRRIGEPGKHLGCIARVVGWPENDLDSDIE